MNNRVFAKTHFESFSSMILYKIPDFYTRNDYESLYEVFSTPKIRPEIVQQKVHSTNKSVSREYTDIREKEKSILNYLLKTRECELNKCRWVISELENKIDIVEATEPVKEIKEIGKLKSFLIKVKTKLGFKYSASATETKLEDAYNELTRDINYVHGHDNVTENDFEKHMVKNFASACKSISNFNKSGRKIFRIEKALMTELSLTDCSKVDSSFLNLPYSTICIHIPYNVRLTIQMDVVKWIYITEYDEKRIDMFCVMDNERVFNYTFQFSDGDIETQVKQQIAETYDNSKTAIEENTKMVSFIMSVILYLNSKDVDKVMMRPMVVDRERHSNISVCSLGSRIYINKDIEKMYEESNGTNVIKVLKWTVRGHFRNQAHGKGLKEHKIIWIRPHLKGKERNNKKAEIKDSKYILN